MAMDSPSGFYASDSRLGTGAMVITTAALGWIVLQSMYYAFFHPLSKYPGPRLAGVTVWWKVYIELVKQESLAHKLIKLHERYGEIVRIGPNELHFSRPSAYHDIYNAKNRWARDETMYRAFGEAKMILNLYDFRESKKRKDVLQPLFSRKAVVDMQYLVKQNVETMCEKIAEQICAGKLVNFRKAFRSCTIDTITHFCFANPVGALNEPDFESPIQEAMEAAVPIINVFKHFDFIHKLVTACPPRILTMLAPEMKAYLGMRKAIDDQVDEAVNDPSSLLRAPHATIYKALLNEEKGLNLSIPDLRDEGLLMVAAGGDTVADACTIGCVHVLHDRAVYHKLKAELKAAWPDLESTPRFEQLESLPYLRAVIKESLRMSHGPYSSLTRIVPKGGALISGEYIPEGAIVGMSNMIVHTNPEVFPDPYTFNPDRWLDASESLDSYLVSFSRGPRSCLGINLAHCELYFIFANLVRRFDMELDGIRPSDMFWRDCYLPQYFGPELKMRATSCS